MADEDPLYPPSAVTAISACVLLGSLIGATRPGWMGPGETWVITVLGALFGLVAGMAGWFVYLVIRDEVAARRR